MGKKIFLIIFVVLFSHISRAMMEHSSGYSSESSSLRSGSFRKKKHKSMLEDADLSSNDSLAVIDAYELLTLYFGANTSYNPGFLKLVDSNIENLKNTNLRAYNKINKIIKKYKNDKNKLKFYTKFFENDTAEKALLSDLIGQSYATFETNLHVRFKKAKRDNAMVCGVNGFIFIVNGLLIVSSLLPILITCYQ